MKSSRFTETQIAAILAEPDAWIAVQRFVASTDQWNTLYNWMKHNGMRKYSD